MLANAVLLIVVAICVVTDLKSRKIYNKVIFPTLVFAFALHAVVDGWSGTLHALLGFAVGLSILLIPYLMGGMGAGDVKLLAVIGAIKGAGFVWNASIYMAIFGAVMALGVLLFKDGIRKRLRFIGYVLLCLRFKMKPNLQAHWTSGAYPYGVAIAGGSIICLCLGGWGAG
ncbi:MAG: A24 family peptidase [Bacillota bacterium]